MATARHPACSQIGPQDTRQLCFLLLQRFSPSVELTIAILIARDICFSPLLLPKPARLGRDETMLQRLLPERKRLSLTLPMAQGK